MHALKFVPSWGNYPVVFGYNKVIVFGKNDRNAEDVFVLTSGSRGRNINQF